MTALEGVLNATTGAVEFGVVGRSKKSFHFAFGTPPVVFSQGTKRGSASIWVADRNKKSLLVFEAEPDREGNLELIDKFQIGSPAKFTHPVAAHGTVYMATGEGNLIAIANV